MLEVGQELLLMVTPTHGSGGDLGRLKGSLYLIG